MLFESTACLETVTILEAVLFRNADACIDIGMVSLFSAIAAFIACVVALRYVGAKLVRRILPTRPASSGKSDEADVLNNLGLPERPYEPPIRSTGAWGGERR